jgi:polar amino acid transport system permease protein
VWKIFHTPVVPSQEFQMADQPSIPSIDEEIPFSPKQTSTGKRLADIPWWFIAIILIAISAAYIIFSKVYLFSIDLSHLEALGESQITDELVEAFTNLDAKLKPGMTIEITTPGESWKIFDENDVFYIELEDQELNVYTNSSYREAFDFIKAGISITIQVSITAYLLAMLLGLMSSLGRISNNVVFNNLSRLYVELIRGIPMLVLIFFIAFVGVPALVDLLATFGFSLGIRDISMMSRAIIALAVTYGAFLAEIFRAGIQSIGRGQMEAARSLGMSYAQAMRYVILPQAIRNVLPALGNDFVAMVKDSSLVSVLAVRDITQMARLHATATFRFRESYIILSVMYLTITVVLSLFVQVMERRLRKND